MTKRFYSVCFFSWLIIVFPAAGIAQEINFQEKASIFINDYNNRDFIGATSLFHFPADYKDKELKADKDGISRTLKMYYEEFGKITDIEKTDNPSLHYVVGIGGGNIPYWQKYPDTVRLFYKVRFSREDKGCVAFYFSNISGKWEIREVKYGLPAERAKAQERIIGVNQKWLKLMGH